MIVRTSYLELGIMLFATAVLACSCGGDSTAIDTQADGVVNDVWEVVGDVLPPPMQACQGAPFDSPAGNLLPQPLRVYSFATPVVVGSATLSWSGQGDDVEDELLALAAARGLDIVAEEGAVSLFFHPDSAWPQVVADCQGAGEGKEDYYLVVAVADGRAVVEIVAGGAAGRFYALKTLRQLLEPGKPLAISPATIFDQPATGTRGVLEGYYGKPWSPEDRLAMVVEAAHLKFNTYVYAPKSAATINTAWMLPYEKEELEHFAELTKVAALNHVRVCFELHPSFLFHYSTPGDFDILLGKFETVIELGIDCVVLAYDDVPPELVPPDPDVYESYTEAQVDFVPRLGEALLALYPDLELAFVPVEYFTQHESASTAWPALGAALQPEWQIAWTGQEIGSTTVTLADAQEATALMGRKPLLGDNYPVSDDAYKTGIVHLGPLSGRDGDLVESLSGLAFNAMPLPYASLPALATCADYAWNPMAYDGEESASNVARFYGGAEGQAGFLTLMMANRSPMLDGSHAPELEAALSAFWLAWESEGDVGIGADVLRSGFFVPYSDAPPALALLEAHPAVASQLLPWAEALGGYGEAGEEALELLAASRAGEAFDTTDFAAKVGALAEGFARPTGSAMDEFLQRTLLELE